MVGNIYVHKNPRTKILFKSQNNQTHEFSLKHVDLT